MLSWKSDSVSDQHRIYYYYASSKYVSEKTTAMSKLTKATLKKSFCSYMMMSFSLMNENITIADSISLNYFFHNHHLNAIN